MCETCEHALVEDGSASKQCGVAVHNAASRGQHYDVAGRDRTAVYRAPVPQLDGIVGFHCRAETVLILEYKKLPYSRVRREIFKATGPRVLK